MKKVMILFMVVSLLLVVGCTENIAEKQMEAQIEAEIGNDADVEIDGDEATIKYEDNEGNDVTVTSSEGSGEWCDDDLFMNVEGMTETGETTYTVNVLGIEKSGEYAGLCKGEVTLTSADGNMYYTYYFDEDEEHGHVIVSGTGVFASYNMEYDF